MAGIGPRSFDVLFLQGLVNRTSEFGALAQPKQQGALTAPSHWVRSCQYENSEMIRPCRRAIKFPKTLLCSLDRPRATGWSFRRPEGARTKPVGAEQGLAGRHLRRAADCRRQPLSRLPELVTGWARPGLDSNQSPLVPSALLGYAVGWSRLPGSAPHGLRWPVLQAPHRAVSTVADCSEM